MVKNILKLEGLIIFFASIYFYYASEGSLILFLILILLPDISMVGYLANKRSGAITYNLVHNYILPIILIGYGMTTSNNIFWQLGWVLLAHVGIDRFLGFGLKYPSSFKDTHIQKV